ncbi:hypothetical protein [Nitrosopumilus cobalaminigenes]|nr:hypothetical protein [Nitrosopumilus cobalaminigenes]
MSVRRNYVINKKLDKKFRDIVNKNYTKGKYSESIEQAIRLWLQVQKNRK